MDLKYLLLFNFFASYLACLPNPQRELGPIITIGEMMEPICDPNPCPTLTGSLVTVSAAIADAACTYTATATCDITFSEIQFNGVAVPAFSTPQTLTCDAATGQYTYTDGGGVQQQITTIACMCQANPCPTLTGSLVTVSAAIADAACTYTASATCDISFSEIQFNGVTVPAFSTPQALICDAGTGQYTYTDGGGVQQPITTIACMCQANPCPTLTGTLVTVSTPTADAACAYTATATCNNPYPRVVQYNGAGDVYMSPQTLTCDTATSQFTYVDMGAIVQQITTIDCVCDANPCPAPTLGAMATVSTPTVDAACTYTSDAMCTPTTFSIQFDGGPPSLMSPQTLTCDFGTMQYTYDNAGTPTPLTSIDCICDVNPCPTIPTGAKVLTSPPMADGSCEYTVQADCMKDPSAAAIFNYNGAGTDFPGIQTWTCDPATMQYTFDNAGTPTPITSVLCICGGKMCVTASVDIGPPGPEPQDMTTCIWDRILTCDPGYNFIEFRQSPPATPDVFPAPKPMRCPGGIPGNWEFELIPGVWVPATNMNCIP